MNLVGDSPSRHRSLNRISPLYISQFARLKQNNIQNINRMEYFMPKYIGGKLLLEGGLGVCCKINDIIFVHGGIKTENVPMPIFENRLLRKPDMMKRITELNKTFFDAFKLNKEKEPGQDLDFKDINSLTWNREFGDEEQYRTQTKATFCNALATELELLCGPNNNCKLVIGHCTQNFNSIIPLKSHNLIRRNTSTFAVLKESDNIREILKPPLVTAESTRDSSERKNTNKIDSTTKSPQHRAGIIFGITTDCNENIFRVDVSANRCNDSMAVMNDLSNSTPDILNENIRKVVLSSVPSVLHFSYINGRLTSTEIIRSTVRNMVIHQPRKYRQDIIDNILRNAIPEILPLPVKDDDEIPDLLPHLFPDV